MKTINPHNQLVASTIAPTVAFPSIYEATVHTPSVLKPEFKPAVKGYKALKNAKTDEVFSVVTDRYNLIPYEASLSLTEDALRQHPEFGTPEREIHLLGDPHGSKVRIHYTFPEIPFDIGSGDIVHPTLDIHSSYDTGWSWWMTGGAYRLVCSNGMYVGRKVCFYKHKHTHGLTFEVISRRLHGALERFSNEFGIWKGWADRILQPSEYEHVMKGMTASGGMGKKAVEALEDEVEAGSGIRINDPRCRTMTMWLFFNVLTQYITHRVKSAQRQADLQLRVRDSFERFRN